MEELERNSGTPVFLGTVMLGTTGELILHSQINKKGVIYKVGPGVLPRHKSREKKLQTYMNSPEARTTTINRRYGRVAGRDSLMAFKRPKKDKDRPGKLRHSYSRGPKSPSKPP